MTLEESIKSEIELLSELQALGAKNGRDITVAIQREIQRSLSRVLSKHKYELKIEGGDPVLCKVK